MHTVTENVDEVSYVHVAGVLELTSLFVGRSNATIVDEETKGGKDVSRSYESF